MKSSSPKKPDRSPKKAARTKSAVPARANDATTGAEDLSGLQSKDETRAERRVEIKPAKGRPMLTWVGKKPLRHAIAYPAQLVETFHTSPLSKSSTTGFGEGPGVGLLFHGDNKDVLAWLLANGYRGKVKLIYIDPPFDSGADYVRKVEFRGGKSEKLEGEGYTLGEQIQYTDIWTNDNYLQFMYERLLMLKELLSEDGFIFLQCDHRKNHHLRCLLDEIFGVENFRNEIASRRGTTSVQAQFDTVASLIPGYYTTLFYSKSHDGSLPILRTQRVGIQPGKWDTLWRNHDRPTMRYELLGVTPTEGQWRWAKPRAIKAVANYKYYQENYEGKIEIDTYILDHLATKGEILDFIRMGPDGTVQCYIPPQQDRLANNVWMDFPHMGSSTEYPTEKSEAMLERVIMWVSNPGDLVLDCFLGSGTTAAVAQKLGRRWIGADINKGAIQTTIKRLQGVMREQSEAMKNKKQVLPGMEEDGNTPEPAQLGFAVYRVNDYDLQIQHNEAFNLAVEHLGMTRTKTDAFFDGTLGKKLVKIVPFNHPVTPLDLEEVKNELKNRPEEERDILVVGLGREYAVQTWLDEWNRLRKQGGIPNKIEVVELRSDPKYGGFFTHEPAKAKVSFKRIGDKVEITIDDFISPTILERLKQQNKDNPLFQPQIGDWRSMVDSVMIDADYDGQVFDITLADVPERKNDLVEGKYVAEAKKDATIAVKVTDMLGEEVLVVKNA
jgi:DNA modification methylase